MCVSIYSENIDRDESKIKWFIEKKKTALFPH